MHFVLGVFEGNPGEHRLFWMFPSARRDFQDDEGWDTLMWASLSGHFEICELLVSTFGMTADYATEKGETALMKAARSSSWVLGSGVFGGFRGVFAGEIPRLPGKAPEEGRSAMLGFPDSQEAPNVSHQHRMRASGRPNRAGAVISFQPESRTKGVGVAQT